jgi:GH24 family phage-related lysozyme (muramidase)
VNPIAYGASGLRQQALLRHIKIREGFKDHVYRDNVGKLTAGTGHLLTEEELKIYYHGARVSPSVLEQWLEEDLAKALSASREQAWFIPGATVKFEDALVSVNFQLGTRWYNKFPTAWQHLINGEWKRANLEIKYVKEGSDQFSRWYKQTPVRVEDFMLAIENLGK